MEFRNLKTGMHVRMKETECCGGYHQVGEECIIREIDSEYCFYCESLAGVGYWHEISCVDFCDEILEDELFEI